MTVATKGRVGETYNIGGDAEATNIDIVKQLCALLDESAPANAPHEDLITYVADRPGHDFRHAIDATKIQTELGWKPSVTLEQGLRKTVEWYLANEAWWRPIQDRY